MTIFVILLYASYKLTILVSASDYKIMNRIEDNHFADTDAFGNEDGFSIAAAVTGFVGAIERVPPKIGNLRFYRKSWGGESWLKFEMIETRPCVRDDFDYGEKRSDNPLFYRTENTVKDLDMYGLSMSCPKNPADISVWGNYNTGAAAAFMVIFEKCDAEKDGIVCSSDHDINEWMEGRYLITLENQRKFI